MEQISRRGRASSELYVYTGRGSAHRCDMHTLSRGVRARAAAAANSPDEGWSGAFGIVVEAGAANIGVVRDLCDQGFSRGLHYSSLRKPTAVSPSFSSFSVAFYSAVGAAVRPSYLSGGLVGGRLRISYIVLPFKLLLRQVSLLRN